MWGSPQLLPRSAMRNVWSTASNPEFSQFHVPLSAWKTAVRRLFLRVATKMTNTISACLAVLLLCAQISAANTSLVSLSLSLCIFLRHKFTCFLIYLIFQSVRWWREGKKFCGILHRCLPAPAIDHCLNKIFCYVLKL